MKKLQITLSVLAFSLLLSGCASPDSQQTPGSGLKPLPEAGQKDKDVVAYVTKADRTKLFERTTFDFKKSASMTPVKITYDKDTDLGEVDGFGTAITQATAYNLLHMDSESRKALLEETFSMDQVGSSLIRVCIGASDFCVDEEFTWCDKPGMENFSMPFQDEKYVIPVLKEIYKINPDVKIIASPWSCPRWMKGTVENPEIPYNSWTSGRLNPKHYEDYAEYFVRWVQAFEKEGFNIYAVTMQNEPLNKGNTISMYMPWEDQLKFIKILGPAFQKAGLDTKILVFDHNYNYDNKKGQEEYPLHIYADQEASKWAAGAAWHNYGGNVSELDNIRSKAPDKANYFTEASIGEWCYDKDGVHGGNFPSILMNDFKDIIWGTLRRGGKGVVYWNFMLDEQQGPMTHAPGVTRVCYGATTVSSDYRTVTKNSQWYNMAQASAVIRPGARRIKAEGIEQTDKFMYGMYRNPDNTIGVMFFNDEKQDRPIIISNDRFSVRFTVPSMSLASLKWQEQ